MKTNDDYLIFCRNIKYLRKKHGLTQSKMAEHLGVSVYCIRKLEKGIFPPRLTIDILYSIYEVFCISPSKIFEPLYNNNKKE